MRALLAGVLGRHGVDAAVAFSRTPLVGGATFGVDDDALNDLSQLLEVSDGALQTLDLSSTGIDGVALTKARRSAGEPTRTPPRRRGVRG